MAAEELDLLVLRNIGYEAQPETWLGIASNDRSMELTLERGQRLVVALRQMLAETIGHQR